MSALNVRLAPITLCPPQSLHNLIPPLVVACNASCVLNGDYSEQYNDRLKALSAVYSTRLAMLSLPGLHVVTHALSTGDRGMLVDQYYP